MYWQVARKLNAYLCVKIVIFFLLFNLIIYVFMFFYFRIYKNEIYFKIKYEHLKILA